MKVILLQDVAKVGKKFDIKEVNDGFGRNFLIARGKAKAVTDSSRETIEKLKASLDSTRQVQEDLMLMNLTKINNLVLDLSAKANSEGHLFAGINRREIVDALREKARIEIEENFVDLDKPIKETGTHEVVIKSGDKKAKLRLIISAN